MIDKRFIGVVVPFSAGGSREEIEEADRLFREAGIMACGFPVEGLWQVEKTVPGRTFEGIDGIREYIRLITEGETSNV